MVISNVEYSILLISIKLDVLSETESLQCVRLVYDWCAILGVCFMLPQMLKAGASLWLSSVLMQRLSILLYLQVIVKIKLLLRCWIRNTFWVSLSRMLVNFNSQKQKERHRNRRMRNERGLEGEGRMAFGMAITIIIKFNYSISITLGRRHNHFKQEWIYLLVFFGLCINSFIIISMEADWQLPQKRQYPLSITFDPSPTDNSEIFLNPFLGYPICPIIGRYNRGEYKIGETLMQVQFKCRFDKEMNGYRCSERVITLPEIVLYNVRNIPEIIPNHKQVALKNAPDFLPEKYPVRDDLSVFWVISFGEIGRDFLNYLNHMYILANTLFQQEKLKREIHYLPIFAHLPPNSGLHPQEVERGLNFSHYRGEYMSFHLNKGAPAFSPNNMRIGVEGGKIITSKTAPKKKDKPKYVQKEKQTEKTQEKQKEPVKQLEVGEEFSLDWDQIMNMPAKTTNPPKPKPQKKEKQPKQSNQSKHQGFIHFYTSLLLEHEHRVYYHWHIEDQYKQEIIKEVLRSSTTLDDFLSKYSNVLGKDPLYFQTSKLLFPQNL